eukprot:TRINITY_DN14154_c0_g3_i1.p1 TRINITY_DN14154_c0_g3~~TRINITY_DN14154_c0_g3_i1.p1  ORF type:complete len:646 (-),score=185.24 TRINITY_DN14154_c0_g3_i1:69-2006(-)
MPDAAGLVPAAPLLGNAGDAGAQAAHASDAAETADCIDQGCWYFQEPTTKQPAGPWTVSQLCSRWRNNRIDGCTLVWRQGLNGGWQPLSEVDELKAALRESVAAEQDGQEEEALTKQAGTQDGARQRRVPLDDVPITHTYTSDQGILYVYDVVDEDWKACDVYEALLAEEAAEQGENAASTPANSSTAAADKQSDEAMQQLLQETEGLGTTLLVSTKQATVRGATVDGADAAANEEDLDPETRLKRQKKREYRERKKLRKQAGLFMKAQDNPNVYVSGLPGNVTQSELESVFKRAGVLKVDPLTGDTKIRIYRENDAGACTGDALVTYANAASVSLALEFLHEHELRPGCRICVQQADFEEHEQAPKLSKEELKALAAKRKGENDRSKYLAAKNAQKEAVSWSGDMDDGTGRRVIVLKRMYTLEEAESEGPGFYGELEEEVREECAKIGQVVKVTPIENHRLGIVCVKFRSSNEAEECIRVMDGRFFAGRTVEASFYDGKTDLKALGVVEGAKRGASAAAAAASAPGAKKPRTGGGEGAPEAGGVEQAASSAVDGTPATASASTTVASTTSDDDAGAAGAVAAAGAPAGDDARGEEEEETAKAADGDSAAGSEAKEPGAKKSTYDSWLDDQSSESDDEFRVQVEE